MILDTSKIAGEQFDILLYRAAVNSIYPGKLEVGNVILNSLMSHTLPAYYLKELPKYINKSRIEAINLVVYRF